MSTRPDDESPDSTPEESSSKSTGSSRQGKPDNGAGLFGLGRMGGGGPRPPRAPRTGKGGGRPGPLVLTISIVAAIAVAIGILSQVWTEVLWFSQIGYARVLWTQWIALIVLFLAGFAIMFGAVFVSMTRAYRAREIGMPDDEASRNLEAYRSVIEPMRRRLTWAVPAVLALFGSAWELAPSWREILLALNSQSFGVKDPQFGIDISFYVFILPAVLTLVSFLAGVVLFSGVTSIVVHYLYGGISVVRKPHFTKAARIHLAHAQTVGIGVLLRRLDFGHHDLAERRRGRAGFFHLKAAHRQGVSQLLGIQRRIAELAQPGFGELHFRGLNVGYFNGAGFVFLAFARFFQWRRPAAPAFGFALSSDQSADSDNWRHWIV